MPLRTHGSKLCQEMLFRAVKCRTNGDIGTSRSDYSLIDEARNTERHRNWNADLKLRHAQVNFVCSTAALSRTQSEVDVVIPSTSHRGDSVSEESTSGEKAGIAIDRPQLLNSTVENSLPSLNGKEECALEEGVYEHPVAALVDVAEAPMTRTSNQQKDDDLFMLDTEEANLPTVFDLQPSCTRSSSSSDISKSSGDVVLFNGRNIPRHSARPSSTRMVGSEVFRLQNPTLEHPQVSSSNPCRSGPGHTLPSVRSRSRQQFRVHQSKYGRQGRRVKQQADMIEADYIANIRDNISDPDAISTSFTARDIGGRENQVLGKAEHEFSRDNAFLDGGWDSDDIVTLDHLSTSSEAPTGFCKVVSKRQRLSEYQYFVVQENEAVGDGRWVSASLLGMPGAAEKIAHFEASKKLDNPTDPLHNDDTSESSEINELATMDLQDEHNHAEYSGHSLKIPDTGMTDEQMATRLAKQEELGVGSSEILLFDGSELSHLGKSDTVKGFESKTTGPGVSGSSGRISIRRECYNRGSTATAVSQDAYDGFGVLDRDRLSIDQRLNARRAITPFELSESDLEDSMQRAWMNDRMKKRERKQAREELRAQGRLGKSGKQDVNAMYSAGISIALVKSELKEFLASPEVMYESVASAPGNF